MSTDITPVRVSRDWTGEERASLKQAILEYKVALESWYRAETEKVFDQQDHSECASACREIARLLDLTIRLSSATAEQLEARRELFFGFLER